MKSNYLTYAVTKACNYRCPYCSSNGQGEAQFSSIAHINPNLVKIVTKIALRNGIRRFRLSGGEPFLHKHLGEIIKNISDQNVDELVVDTNASLVSNKLAIINDPPQQLKIVCSIDSLDEKTYDFHAGAVGYRDKAIENIKLLHSKGILKRINMVVTKKNYKEVILMAKFCKELNVPLKLSDVSVRRNQIGKFEDIYMPLSKLKEYLSQQGKRITNSVDYSQNFGTPCDTFKVKNQIIKIKDSAKGAKYNMPGPCGTCNFFPCSEGLYFITVLPDGTFSGCQSNGFNYKLSPEELKASWLAEPDSHVQEKIQTIVSNMTNIIENAILLKLT